MHMVRHDQHEVCVPYSLRDPMFDRFEDAVCKPGIGKLVPPALLTTDRNEIMRFAWINPKRHIMWQVSAIRY